MLYSVTALNTPRDTEHAHASLFTKYTHLGASNYWRKQTGIKRTHACKNTQALYFTIYSIMGLTQCELWHTWTHSNKNNPTCHKLLTPLQGQRPQSHWKEGGKASTSYETTNTELLWYTGQKLVTTCCMKLASPRLRSFKQRSEACQTVLDPPTCTQTSATWLQAKQADRFSPAKQPHQSSDDPL